MNRKKAKQRMAILYSLLWFIGLILLSILSEALFGLNDNGQIKDWTVIFIILYMSFISVMIYKLDPYKININNKKKRCFKQENKSKENIINLINTKKQSVDEVKPSQELDLKEKIKSIKYNINTRDTNEKPISKLQPTQELSKKAEQEALQKRMKENELAYKEFLKQKEIEQKNRIIKKNKELELKLKELNISKKLYDKSKHYYNRTVFKERLNPIDKWDLELIQTEEIHFLNQLGLISQDFTYPYWVNIITDELIKEHAFKLRNYQADKKIHIPKIAPLDDLKNTSQLVDLAILILEKKRFKNIRKLAKHEQFGVDIIAEKDDSSYAFKCKYLSRNKVGKNDVQQAAEGAKIHHYSQAMMVTNSYFTKSAKITAENNDVMLCDRICLAEYILKTPPYNY